MAFHFPSTTHLYKRLSHSLTTSQLPVLPVVLLFVLIPGILYELHAVYRVISYNRSLENPSSLDSIDVDTPHHLFANAAYLDSEGHYQEALQVYNRIEHHKNTALRERVKYNMGTIYLREAAKQWNTQGVWAYAQVNTLLKLAEQAFKSVLRLNSGNWDARYNLEYALRIRPPEKTEETANWEGRKRSVYAIFPGVPGGGP